MFLVPCSAGSVALRGRGAGAPASVRGGGNGVPGMGLSLGARWRAIVYGLSSNGGAVFA